ncbi:MAG: serine/threonine protein kinase, partial [Limisphaerales bacterium]
QYGKYLLLDRIAVGGMAEIFLARQMGPEGFEKTVVLKRIRPHLGDKKSFVRMFLNEAKLAAQLNHPNIIHIHDLGKVGASYFIAMEYLFGRDMRRVMPKCEQQGIAFPVVYACKIASQVLEGLYYAHQKTDTKGRALGIVHRDVSFKNIMIAFEGDVKLTDFGIAKARGFLTDQEGEVVAGKADYMSPEQANFQVTDKRSDLFSAGVVLSHLLLGRNIFKGTTAEESRQRIINQPIPDFRTLDSRIDDELNDILQHCLTRDLKRRYATADELMYDLEYHIYHGGYGPTNETLGKFIRELFDQTDSRSVAEDKHSKTAMLEESARLKQRAK